MRYFTAERWLRLQVNEPAEAVLGALDDWNRAIADYRTAVNDSLQDAPRELRRFALSVSLHDGVLAQSWREGKKLYLLVQLPHPQRDRVLLTYSLVDPPVTSPSGIPEQYLSRAARWMYDEVEVEPAEAASPPRGRHVYRHHILFGNGWEVCIRFTGFRYALPDATSLFPPMSPRDQVPASSLARA
jgi:hypothetical protein